MKLPKECSKKSEPRFESREVQVLQHLQVSSRGGGSGSEMGIMEGVASWNP